MRTLRRRIDALLYTASAFACLQAMPAYAQSTGADPVTAADSRGQTVEEVVVTARKRSESLQKVPVAVTAFTAAYLANNPVHGIVDIIKDTPNLAIRLGTQDPFSGSVAIRGQFPEYINLVSQPSVGIYINDVYQATSGGATVGNFFDVDGIEVLKGPQGTLYGRNSTGGAIKISSPLPNYDGYSGKFKFGYGDYGQNEEGFAINIPLINDKLAARLSAQHVANDGYGHIIGTDTPVNDADSKSLNLALRFDPTDELRLIFRADYSYSSSHGNANNLILDAPFTSSIYTQSFPFNFAVLNEGLQKGIFNASTLFGNLFGFAPTPGFAGQVAAATAALNQNLIPNGSHDAFSAIDNPESILRSGGVSLAGTYDFNDSLSLKSITAYRGSDDIATDDAIGTNLPILAGTLFSTRLEQITQELQLNGKALDSKLKYALGYYYFFSGGDDNSSDFSTPTLFSIIAPSQNPGVRNTHVEDESHSVYGQGTYALTDAINATVGLRWTTEALNTTSTSFSGNPAMPLNPAAFTCTASLPSPPIGSKCFGAYNSGFRNISYTYGLDWSPANNLLTYIKTSRGFKAGGINNSGDYGPIKPEIVTDYEVGLKSDWFDRKLRVNTAVFYSDFKGIQQPVITMVNGQTATEILNAADASITGVEFETIAKPIDHLDIRANAAYLFTQYGKFNTLQANGGSIDRSGARFDNVPRWKTSVTAAYTYPFDFGALRTSVDWTFQSTVALSALAENAVTQGFNQQSGYSLWNGRISLNIEQYDLEVAGYIKNLTNKSYFQNKLDLSQYFGVVSGQLGPPRTFGFEITKYF